MQNKCNNGCNCQMGAGQGFIPVNGNWDFNCCDQYQQNHIRRNCQPGAGCQSNSGRRGNDCDCDERERNYTRNRNDKDCQCERCDDSREVACCGQNTYIRDMDECDCNANHGRSHSNCTGDDDCQCETCVRDRNRRNNSCEKDCKCGENKHNDRNRSGSCGCEENNGGYNRRRSNCGCDKDKDNASTYARSGKNRRVGMVNVEMQEIDEIFESESALRAGTIFPELHKPMNGYCPCDENCGTCKQAAAFAAWELRLYLNTHPNDKEALALFRKLCKEAEDENYATTFLTDDCCTNGWNWVKNPWPWEYDCQCGD